jgi:peptidoglycan/LPS O-acetylase OafA/YrhL
MGIQLQDRLPASPPIRLAPSAVGRSDGTSSLLLSAPAVLGRSGGIDALRAVFAIWVVLFHLVPLVELVQGAGAIPGWLDGAWDILERLVASDHELHPAVLGFIVLSGYCIHRNGLRAPHVGLRAFAMRRALRILPVFWLACLFPILTLPFDVMASPPMPQALHSITTLDPACLLTKMTAIQAVTPAFFDPVVCPSQGNGALMTVMVEIVLYALYAFFFALFVWRGREYLLWLVCGCAYACGLLVAELSAAHSTLYIWWQNASVYGFLPYWWLGAALIDQRVRAFVMRHVGLFLIIYAALLVAIPHAGEHAPVLAELRKLVFALAIGAAICRLDEAGIGQRNPLSAIGRAGYSLYAFHVPLIVWATLYGVPWWLTFAATIALALAMHATVERPCAQLGRYLASRYE